MIKYHPWEMANIIKKYIDFFVKIWYNVYVVNKLWQNIADIFTESDIA